jgi:hypothetical protein
MGDAKAATQNPAAEVAKVLRQLTAIKGQPSSKARSIRWALRNLGHRGGTRTAAPKVPTK